MKTTTRVTTRGISREAAKKTAAILLAASIGLSACSPPTPEGDEVTQPGTTHPAEAQLPPNGTTYEERDLQRPIPVEGEYDYLNLSDIGEARLLASIAGEEDPGRSPGINILIKHGEPIPANVKEEIEERYFRQGERMFIALDSAPADAEVRHFDRYSFLTRTAGPLERLSELSGTYVDIVFPQRIISEDFDYYVGTRVWDTIEFVGFTETLEEYLANYEGWLIEEGITDYELWVLEPRLEAPWIK